MPNWIYKGEPITELPDGTFGFVYRITSMVDGKKYIGRKYARKTTRKPTKKKDGTKSLRKKKIVSESDWRSYKGSCQPLLKDIETFGEDSFEFEILCMCPTKGSTNFAEEYCQMRAGVLFDDSYYNDSIGSRGFLGVKFTEEFTNILKNIEL